MMLTGLCHLDKLVLNDVVHVTYVDASTVAMPTYTNICGTAHSITQSDVSARVNLSPCATVEAVEAFRIASPGELN